MLKIIGILVVCAVFLVGCRQGEDIESEDYFGFFLSDFVGLNYLVNGDAATEQTAAVVVEALARANRFGMVEHALADRWTAAQNYTVWEVRIRRGAGWYCHEGQRVADITADDFVAAMEFILDERNNSAHFNFVSRYISAVEARNRNTIVYRLNHATPYFPSLLTKMPFLPVNREFFETVGDSFGTSPETLLYSGSHIITRWDDEGLGFAKNEEYHLAGRVHVDNITLTHRADDAVGMFKAGYLSQAVLSPNDTRNLLNDSEWASFVLQTLPKGDTWFFAPNFGSLDADVAAAFQNANFRRAVFASINRDALLGLTVTENRGEFLANTISAPRVSFNARNRDYLSFGALPALLERQTYDPPQAMRYLTRAVAELGDTVTWPVTLMFPRKMTEFGIMESELYRQMIESALDGFVLVGFRTYIEEWELTELLVRGELDIVLAATRNTIGDPSAALGTFAPGGFAHLLLFFDELEQSVTFAEMFAESTEQTDINARFARFAAAEIYLVENALALPFRRSGGEFKLSRDRRPFHRAYAEYGLSRFLFIDRVFGEPLTAAEHRQMLERFTQEFGYLAR